MSVYAYYAATIKGEDKALSDYRGKVLLIVNTASKCGLTPQYEGLQKLYEQYKDRGLEILGFPCNQFAGQEPEGEEAIASFCKVNYGVTFPLFSKIEVNGEGTHPLYAYLKSHSPNNANEDIEWNFAKFLVGRDGDIIRRYSARTEPQELAIDIEESLKARA
ncbi:glutathione peroxidase [Gorillibacterium massiliense]|uniref:glutathione peroxidase n=1 Tax=Gorillibacterium massiliense TaxID=1280390 RepID=UPI0005927A9A|nr:glutathione peroxidase [Gorillibacterium massiliense]